jgi:threonine dehydratase
MQRGLGNLCRKTIERLGPNRESHFYCSSEGNAGNSPPKFVITRGLAAASAARILGKKATICVTHNTPSNILERLKAEGAEVRQNGYYWSDADYLCRELVNSDPNGV